MSSLPILLPASVIPKSSPSVYHEWKPQRYLSEPQPPPQDDGKIIEQEMASARQMLDGKIIKKTRPRRTVDYNGTLGRWALVSSLRVVLFNHSLTGVRMQLRKLRPNPGYVPHLRPSPSFIIDVRDIGRLATFKALILYLATPPKSISRKPFYLVVHQIRPHVNEQNSMSSECRHGKYPFYSSVYPASNSSRM